MVRSNVLGRLLARSALAYMQFDRLVSAGLAQSRALAEAFFSESLSPSERGRLALCIYGRRAAYGPPGLFAWERSWYERDLPAPPAPVLVAGCGSGRELRSLLRQGYRVSGFEPVSRLCSSARRELGAHVEVHQFGYEDLSDPSVQRQLLARAPYDAVILGWASFSHVLDKDTRLRAVRILDRLCPRGPLLVSFHGWRPAEFARRVNPLATRARRVGRRLGELRQLPSLESEREVLLPHAGFVHRFSEEELLALARTVDRDIRWGDDQRTCGHASFFPATRG